MDTIWTSRVRARGMAAALAAALVASMSVGSMGAAAGGAASASSLGDLARAAHAVTAPATPVVVTDEVALAVADGGADVIVRARPDALDAALAATVEAGGTIGLRLELIDGFSAHLTTAALSALTTVDGVLDITLDAPVTLAHVGPNGEAPAPDSSFVETIGADDLHAAGHDGSGVGIAIIDTGVANLPDFAGRIVGAVDFSGDGNNQDAYGHGTFIAGLAAGDGSSSNGEHAGVAPGAHVIPVKIAGQNGSSDVSHVLAAMQYVVSFRDTYDIRVLNLSLGTDSTQPQTLSPLNHAVERAWDAGIVVVVSGGNHGEEGPGRIPKPADDPLVLTVGATDSMDTIDRADDVVAGFSSIGPSIADGFEKPDIVAPGAHLVSLIAPGSALATNFPTSHLDSAHAQGSGTSFAAGVVSGAAALLLDAHPDWTPDQVKDAITQGAVPGPVGDRNVDGFGAIDLPTAVAQSPAPGSQGLVVRSSGLGSIAADRGSLAVTVSTSGLWNTIAWLLGHVVQLNTNLTAQLDSFDAAQYSGSNWYGSNWYGSNWYGSNWYGSNWYGSNWYGSNWYGSNWYGSNWYGSDWY